MPSIKVNCPLCPEKVYDCGLGSHFLSKTHAAHLLKENQKLKTFLQDLKANCLMLNGKNNPPLFSVTKTDAYHICLSCKKCYKNDDANTGAMEHYRKSPKCKENGIAKLEAFLFPVAKVSGGNEVLIEELKKKDQAIIAAENGRTSFMNRFDIADTKNDRLLSLLSKMCGPDFDIYDDDHLKKLEDFLDADSGNQGYYMKPFIQVQKEEPVDQ
jgi:hypothetical protein